MDARDRTIVALRAQLAQVQQHKEAAAAAAETAHERAVAALRDRVIFKEQEVVEAEAGRREAIRVHILTPMCTFPFCSSPRPKCTPWIIS